MVQWMPRAGRPAIGTCALNLVSVRGTQMSRDEASLAEQPRRLLSIASVASILGRREELLGLLGMTSAQR